jgi:hypothetical protein
VNASKRWRLGTGLAIALAVALSLAVLQGCGGTQTPATKTGGKAGGASAGQTIPPGKTIPGTGTGEDAQPTYTFREIWRRALPVAHKWRAGAYLSHAEGSDVADDGTAGWRLIFIDKSATDTGLVVTMDAHGAGIVTNEAPADSLKKAGPGYGDRIPPFIIDSDDAMAVAKANIAPDNPLLKMDPEVVNSTLELSSDLPRNGPQWWYMLSNPNPGDNTPAAKVHMNAFNGKVLDF